MFQGVYAFAGVTGFWQARRHAAPGEEGRRAAAFEFALRRTQTAYGVRLLREHADLTAMGDRFLRGIEDRLEPWLAEPVSGALLRYVDDLTTDHRLLYRMRHLVPDPEEIRRWARAWRLGTPPPDTVPKAVLRGGRTGEATRPALARLRIGDPAGFARLLEKPGAPLPDGTDVPAGADLAWATGDAEAASRGYLDRLAANPDDIASWSGLAVTLPEGLGGKALRRRPEVVLHVHRAVRRSAGGDPDPVLLADWNGLHL